MARLSDVIGNSPGVRAVKAQIERLLDRPPRMRRVPPLLLEGETGTGKGLLARTIHQAGPRRDGPLVEVNCAAIPDTMLEAEVFGFERGAFTDARQAKPGLLEAAHGGTLFLDEVGQLPEALQPKLLKAVEERSVRRLGSTRDRPVDVWIVAATGEDLEALVRAGRFRADLYHRLAVFTVRMPPLRERGTDVLLLAEHFLDATCRDYGLLPKRFTDDARAALATYRWPGNVRELANFIERAALLADGPVISALDLDVPSPPLAREAPHDPDAGARNMRPGARSSGAPLAALTAADERARLLDALQQSGGNLSRAAARLDIPRNTLRYRLEVHGFRAAPPSRRAGALRPQPEVARPPQPPVDPTASAGVASPAVHRETRRLAMLGTVLGRAGDVAPHGAGQALRVVADKLVVFGGTLDDLGEDHVFALFGHDGAEDAARHAALAALAARRAVEQAVAPGAGPFTVTTAIHVHECAVDVMGDTVTIDAGSRHRAFETLRALMALAAPGDIVTSQAAAGVLERRFGLVALAELPDGAGNAYRLGGSERAAFDVRGRVTPFVGRREELAWLRARLRVALDGAGQVIGIAGEAGIGKSRLIAELGQDPLAREVLRLEGRCLSYARTTPYLPVLTIVKQLCKITDARGADDVAAAVQSALATAEMEPGESARYLVELIDAPGHLAGMSPEVVRTRTFETLRTLILQASRRQPILLVIEDLHWIDETSEALLTVLIDSLARARVLLLVTYRPGYRPHWLDKSYTAQLTLQPLSSDESLTVVQRLLAKHAVPKTVVQAMIARGEGNPFFLEELGRAVVDSTNRLDMPVVPGTVHDVLAGRIARLGTGDRRLLQCAAAIGRDVGDDLLRAVADEPEAIITSRLQRLQAAEFLMVTSPGPGLEYTFKHALTHEVAYRSLVPDARRQLHARIVDALERLRADRVTEHVEAFAHHALNGEQWEAAVRYLRRAVAKALARSANREAVTLVEQALGALVRLPDGPERTEREIRLHITRGVALIGMHGWAHPVVKSAYARARELGRRVGQTPRLLGALLGLWAYHLYRGEHDVACELAEQCLAVVAPYPTSPLRGWAHLAAGVSSFWLGRLSVARDELDLSIALYDIQEQGALADMHVYDCGVTSLAYLAVLQTALGFPDRGVARAEEAVALAGKLDHPYTTSVALTMAAITHQLRRDADAARQRAEAAIALAADKGFPVLARGSMATFLRGWALSEADRRDEGIEEMRRGIGASRTFGLELASPWFLTLLADALARQGRTDEALDTIAGALAASERNNDRWYQSETHRVHSMLLRQQRRHAEAEATLRRAIGLARGRDAAWLELRAVVALSRVLQETGRRTEAVQRLGDICGRITEGTDAADLVEARARLDELR